MNFRSTLLRLAFALVLTALALRAESYRFETQVYVLASRDLPPALQADSSSSGSPMPLVFSPPATLTFAHDTLALIDGHFVWNDGRPLSANTEVAAALPAMAIRTGQPLSLTSSSAAQYLEPAPGGGYQLAEIPANSPGAPQCRFVFSLRPGSSAPGTVALDAQLMLDTVRAREPVPGVALAVGKPQLARFESTVAVTVQTGDWSAILLRAPNGSDYSVLVLLRLVSPAAVARQLVKVGDYPLSEPRSGAATVADDHYLYITAGVNQSGILEDIERFDLRTHTSAKLPAKLTPRHHHGAALLNGKLYLIGGIGYALGRTSPNLDSVEIVDLATGQVSQGAPLPFPASAFGCTVVGGKIYVIGGVYSRPTNRTLIYDPATNAWTEGPYMPTDRAKCPAVAYGDRIIVSGGYRNPRVWNVVDNIESFDTRRGRWTRLPDLGAKVSTHSAAVLDDCLFVFGNYSSTARVLAYDLVTHDTTELRTTFAGTSESSAVTIGDQIYVVGGRDRSRSDASELIQVFALRPPTP